MMPILQLRYSDTSYFTTVVWPLYRWNADVATVVAGQDWSLYLDLQCSWETMWYFYIRPHSPSAYLSTSHTLGPHAIFTSVPLVFLFFSYPFYLLDFLLLFAVPSLEQQGVGTFWGRGLSQQHSSATWLSICLVPPWLVTKDAQTLLWLELLYLARLMGNGLI